MRLNIKNSIGISVVVIGLTVAIIAFGHIIISKSITNKIQEDLVSTRNVLTFFQSLRYQDLIKSVKLVTEIPHLKAVVTTEDLDNATVFDSAKSIQDIIKSDLFIITDIKGKLLADVRAPGRFGDDLSENPMFAKALQGESFQGIWYSGSRVYQVIVSPFLFGNDVLGALLIGFVIDEETIQAIEKITNANIFLVIDNQIVAAPGKKEGFQQFLREIIKYDIATDVLRKKINDENFLFLKVPIEQNGLNGVYVLTRSLDKELLFFYRFQKILVLVAAIILVFALAFGMMYSKNITRPVDALMEGVQRVSKGDLNTKVERVSNDELGNLADAFNAMTTDIKTSREELQVMQEKLFQSEKLKIVGQLSAGVAHEVKNPLMIILMGLRVVTKKVPMDDPDVKTVVAGMEKAVHRANSVIKGLLDLSRISRLDMTTININENIQSTVEFLQSKFEEYKVEIKTELGSDIPEIKCDVEKIEQVLENIFHNSMQAMSKGGNITVRTSLSKIQESNFNPDGPAGDDAIKIEIEDSGDGIPEDVIDKIFDPFFTTKGGKGGTGLGLAIIKNIIELHRGKIYIENREGGGVRTTILLRIDKV